MQTFTPASLAMQSARNNQQVRGQYRATNWFTNLHPFFQGTIIVSGIAIVGYSAYRIDQYVKNQSKISGAKDELKDVNKDIKILESKGVVKTLTNAQITSLANQFHTAMDGYGTDTESIGRILKQIKNDVDWLAIVSAYGIRKISSGTWNPAGDFTGTLPEALSDELGGTEASAVNTYFQARKINYRV